MVTAEPEADRQVRGALVMVASGAIVVLLMEGLLTLAVWFLVLGILSIPVTLLLGGGRPTFYSVLGWFFLFGVIGNMLVAAFIWLTQPRMPTYMWQFP